MRQLLFVLFLLAASPLADAAPLHYRFDIAVASSTGEPSGGPQIRVDITDSYQPAPLPQDDPMYELGMYWMGWKTNGTISVSGTAAYDGTHEVSFQDTWSIVHSRYSAWDVLTTPIIKLIQGNETQIVIPPIRLRLPNVRPFGPRPFEFSDILRLEAPIVWMRDLHNRRSMINNAFAVAVPEPSTLALGSVALLSLTTFRRRRHSC